MTFIATSDRHLRSCIAAILIGSVCVLGVPPARATPVANDSLPTDEPAGGKCLQPTAQFGVGRRAGLPATHRGDYHTPYHFVAVLNDDFYKTDITEYVNKNFATQADVLGGGASQD